LSVTFRREQRQDTLKFWIHHAVDRRYREWIGEIQRGGRISGPKTSEWKEP